LGLQALVLASNVAALGLAGLGIDFIRCNIDPSARAPAWPFAISPPEDWSAMAVLFLLAALILLLAVARAFLSYAYSLANVRLVQQGIVVDLRARVYDQLQRLSFRFFDANACGTLINRVTGDVQSVRLFVDGVVIQTAILLISLLIYLGYMLHIHVLLTFVCLSVIPLIWLGSVLFSCWVRPVYTRNRELADELVLYLAECIQGMPVIKGFTREPEVEAKFARANRAVRDQKQKIFWLISSYSPAVELLTQCSLMILLGYGGWLVIHDRLPLGTGLIVFLGLLQRFSAQLNTITGIADSAQQSLAAARRVFEVLDTPRETRSPTAGGRRGRLHGAVCFDQVSFRYDTGAPVLVDVSIEVPAGQCVGILGPTGAGKSTLLSLIPRFYDPAQGRVLVDGFDIREMELGELRRQVGLVFQENFLFSNTVAANIAFGQPGATSAQIERAARIARAHDFIVGLPAGYETVLGEAGVDLSGGQRQRLAIARAILLEPPILLLDDPTAAVDAETELEILDGIEGARQGRTTFLVTHRLSTLRRADRIVVLHRGRIEQVGTHEQLIREKGYYRRTARVQFDQESLPERRVAGGEGKP
jgi:ATP-binding cassette subfamily B protein